MPFESEELRIPGQDDLALAIRPWVAQSRWHQGESARISPVFMTILEESPECVALWLVGEDEVRYNIPLLLRPTVLPQGDPSAVGQIAGWDIFDATDDPAGQAILLGHSLEPRSALIAHPIHPVGKIRSAHRLTSEQSNTSIIYTLEDSSKIIIKIFRIFSPGRNPDVELQRALDPTGTVPRQFGSAQLEVLGETADVVAIQEFLEGSTDAWQVLIEDLAQCDGTLGPLSQSIPALGRLTRRFHTALARDFPTVPADPERIASIREAWERRAHVAIDRVPDLAGWEENIHSVYAATAQVQWPNLQRIHGDYHLGQVLDVPDRGWFALDFEGEPLRALSERNQPDLALRDVAGMLRSFDYAVGSATRSGVDPENLAAWQALAQDAFLDGYGSLDQEEQVLLDALMLDKALYEVTYEVAQRPSWLPIPMAGVRRILQTN